MIMIINDLPPEILSEIFLWANDEDCTIAIGRKNQRYVQAMHPRWVPFSLIHVCQYWRETALSIQSLWTYLCGDISTPTAIEQWFKFSSSANLRLTLSSEMYGYPYLDDPIVDRTKKMLQLFARYSNRWESLLFSAHHPDLIQEFANVIRDSASSSPIRCLEIYLNVDATTHPIIDNLTSSIASFHSLRTFFWAVHSTHSTTIPNLFPWNKLNVVHVDAIFHPEEAIRYLAQCTSATQVTLLGRSTRGQDRPAETFKYRHSTLPSLKSLTLDEGCNPFILLQYFTLPSLTLLEIRTYQGCSPVLEEFLNRSQCPLLTLRIGGRGSDMSNAEVIGYLLIACLRTVDVAKVYVRDAKKRFRDIVEEQPDVMLRLPHMGVVEGICIGWTTRSDKVVVK